MIDKGDIVKIVQFNDVWGNLDEWRHDYYKDYIGNLGLVVGITKAQNGHPASYALELIDEIPFSAWYTDAEVELVDKVEPIEKRLERIKANIIKEKI